MAIDEYKALNKYEVLYETAPTPPVAYSFKPVWSGFFGPSFSDMFDMFFEEMFVSEDCRQETFAEDSPDFA